MKIEFNLNTTVTQSLIINQNMKLSLKILQMTTKELNDFIKKEESENLFMEVKKEGLKINKISSINPYEFIGRKVSFYDYLHDQIREIIIDNKIKEICHFIIDNIGSNGYLNHWVRHLYNPKKFEKALKIVRSLEPRGVAGDNLKECLLLQLEEKDTNEKLIIENHLEDLASNKIDRIKRKLEINDEDLNNSIMKIKSLNPIPSRGFYVEENNRFIEPDVRINKNDMEITFTTGNIPEILIEQSEGNNYKNTEYNKYVVRCQNRAKFIIKCIKQRQKTFEIVTKAIIKIQGKYIKGGELEGLTLIDIGDEIGVHASTVSRAIRNRCIEIDGKVVPLKQLFAKKFNSKKITRLCIKNEIKKIIDEEDEKKPYSDENIAKILSKKGIKISRRTIVKYRKELCILTSAKRKNKEK